MTLGLGIETNDEVTSFAADADSALMRSLASGGGLLETIDSEGFLAGFG